jgi:hypothetical protein
MLRKRSQKQVLSVMKDELATHQTIVDFFIRNYNDEAVEVWKNYAYGHMYIVSVIEPLRLSGD